MKLSDRSITNRVVREVADTLDVDPLDLDPLYETVDPDALDALFQSGSDADFIDRIELSFEGCAVVVYETGEIDVSESGEDSTTTGPVE